MDSVFVTITILNGYKNIDGVFAKREDAENRKEEMESSHHFKRHEIYVCEYIVD